MTVFRSFLIILFFHSDFLNINIHLIFKILSSFTPTICHGLLKLQCNKKFHATSKMRHLNPQIMCNHCGLIYLLIHFLDQVIGNNSFQPPLCHPKPKQIRCKIHLINLIPTYISNQKKARCFFYNARFL